MTTARNQGKCPGCGGQIFPGEEIDKTPAGWLHAHCAPQPSQLARTWSEHCSHCGQQGHAPDIQERINARGTLKIHAALAGDDSELDRLAGLPSTCTQTERDWYVTTYNTAA